MTLKEHIEKGGKFYQRLHMGNDLFRFVLKGIDFWGNPNETFQQEAKDIKEGKTTVLCPKGYIISTDVTGSPVINWGVYVIYPKVVSWSDSPKLKNFREMTLEEILEKEKSYEALQI